MRALTTARRSYGDPSCLCAAGAYDRAGQDEALLAPVDGSDLDGLVDPLERELARIGKPEPGGWKIGEGSDGDEDLLAAGRRPDARGEVHAATHVVAALAGGLGRVEPDPDPRREAMFATVARKTSLDVDGAFEGIHRPLEGDEEPVARVVDHDAVVLPECVAQLAVLRA